MTPADLLRATRLSIGASNREMADLVGLAGAHANDRLIEMEDGRREVSGPISRVLDYMSQGVDLGAGGLLNTILNRYLPAFVELRLPVGAVDQVDQADQAAGEEFLGLLHTRYPRFVAVFSEQLPAPMRARLADSGLEQLEMPQSTGLGTLVAIPLDRHHGSLAPLMAEAAKLVPKF